MSDLVSNLGIDPGSNKEIFLFCAAWTFTVVTVLWVVGLTQKSHSIMDAYYGFGYAIPAVFAYLIVKPASAVSGALLVMVLLHACRLGWYLAARMYRYFPMHGGDPRYIRFVTDLSPGYWWKSFFKVMEPQAVIIVLIGSPAVMGILMSREATGPLGILGLLGIAVFGIGLYFESLGDGQLQAFLALERRPRYLNTGVWKHTRHPNYFGTSTVWWGMWLVAMDGNPDVWWTVAGPIVNTVMLSAVLGSAFQDNYMGVRPEYQEVMARTRRFLPFPLSASQLAANQSRITELSNTSTSSSSASS